jgi:hypothetical protein
VRGNVVWQIGITYAAGKFIQARLNLDIVWQIVIPVFAKQY